MPRDVRTLLLDLLADAAGRRERAGRLLTGRENEQLGPQVARAVAAPGFPRERFYRVAAERIITAQKRWVLGMTVAVRPAADPRSTDDPHRREGIERCAAIDTAIRRDPPGGAGLGCADISLRTVLPYAVYDALEAPSAVWALLETRGCEHVAAETLENAGTRAAPLFLPELLRFFTDWGFERVNHTSMLARVGRGDPRVIDAALAAISNSDGETDHAGEAWPWASVLSQMGTDAATPEALASMHAYARSPLRLRRAMAATTLPRLAPDDPASAEVVLRLLHDQDVGAEDSVLPAAIDGAAHLPKFADRLAPRLVELLTTFEEPNPDYSYYGRAARVCGALLALPHAAQSAVPALRVMLRDVIADQNLFLGTSMLQVLQAAGDAAAAALPELHAMRDMRGDRAAESGAVREDVVRLIRKLSAKPGRGRT